MNRFMTFKTKAKRPNKFVPTPEERAVLLEALTEEEAEDRGGIVITLKDIERTVSEMIENHRKSSLNQSV